ncbi:odorant receptor Or1-like [Tribolium madens]|uniref:odorant receptor Or1-like n=1 Tax=Tribolium madens TaxID=41895 RepID=UPI001CF73179|nr:odorant receptor Or1-like [Tribolium madens]
MEEFSWKETLSQNINFLKVCGLWPPGDEDYKLNLYGIYAGFCVLGFLCVHTGTQTFNIYFIIDDLEAFTSSIFVTFACVACVFKTYYLLKNMKLLKVLFINIDKEIFQPRNHEQELLIQPSIKFWKGFYLIFRILCYNTCFFWCAYPILDKRIKQHKLPFLAWYPYDSSVSPMYEITYFYQAVAIWYIVIISFNTDVLIGALNMFVGAQCDILCDNLRNLAKNGINELNQNLINCIKHHKAILSFVSKSNIFFNWIVFLQFFSSAVSVGFTMFELTLVAPFSGQFYSFICYGSAITTEMFIYCWFGNEIEIKSNNIPYAAFECDWVGAPLEVQKNLIIFTIRTQRPMQVSALNLFYLSLETFKTILRTSWSYFTVLNQVHS